MGIRRQDNDLKAIRKIIDSRIKRAKRQQEPRISPSGTQVMQRLSHDIIDPGLFGENINYGMRGYAAAVTIWLDKFGTLVTMLPTEVDRNAFIGFSPIYLVDRLESNYIEIHINSAAIGAVGATGPAGPTGPIGPSVPPGYLAIAKWGVD